MSVSDFIADQLTIIRNGIRVNKKSVIVRNSKMMEGILNIFKREEFIDNFKIIEDNKQGTIKVYLRYTEEGTSVIENLQKVSTPGLRQYIPTKQLKLVMGGIGVAIYSTSKGLLTDKEVKEQGIGGELICKIW